MKNNKRLMSVSIAIILLVVCLLCAAAPVMAESVLPNTGEKPSAKPYILAGVMALCVVIIVLLFLPRKKKLPEVPKTDEEDEIE